MVRFLPRNRPTRSRLRRADRGGQRAGRDAFGIYFIAWAVISNYHWIAAAATIKMNVVVFGHGTAALYVLGIAAFTENLTLNNVGGWLLLAIGVGQLYLSAAPLINEMYRRRGSCGGDGTGR